MTTASSAGRREPVYRITSALGHRIPWRELWEYHELLYFFAWRDIKVRYKQTAVGICWVLIQPIAAMLVFTLFFGRLAGMPSDNQPYAVFALTGLLPWQFFSYALTNASVSLVLNEKIVSKVYFPRMFVPAGSVIAGLVDLAVSMVLLAFVVIGMGIDLRVTVLALPLFVLLAVITALGVAFWLSSLDVRYRDVRYTLPFLTQLWLFATPVVYPSSIVPEAYRMWFGLNPMAGVVEGFRWAVLGSSIPSVSMLATSALVACALLYTGVRQFRRMEHKLADIV